ncbi:MAG: hypothetical protein JOZ47_17740 [Kutzneria sp.]|nr:hypothetical protein [Kutzneria sp.]
MARLARLVGVLPLFGAMATAGALTGAAVFTVATTSCSDAGQYVQRPDGAIELVGSCLSSRDFPKAPADTSVAARHNLMTSGVRP